MNFPPIKADRCLLWVTLAPGDDVRSRYETLRAVLRQCRLHPLDMTASSELVIVEEAAFRQHLDEVRAVLHAGDMLHLISRIGERLTVEVIAGGDAVLRPPWQAG